jgi:hypothetical protein
MPTFDTPSKTALAEQVVRPRFFIFLDVDGDPVRVTTFAADVTFTGTGDEDLDGHTFSAMDPSIIAVGDIQNQTGGSDTLTIDLAGILTLDDDMLAAIGDRSKWQGRTARLWMQIMQPDNTAVGAVASYYTGYMVAVEIQPSPETQTIRLYIENYMALLTQPSGRTYMSQKEFDSADNSATASIAAANNAGKGPGALIGAGGGLGTSGSDAFQNTLNTHYL